jgi:hypothetical protein
MYAIIAETDGRSTKDLVLVYAPRDDQKSKVVYCLELK